ncbi:MAG: FapA family protein [Desulfobacula sp.]|nr:FapA family protein [Desulfobacula sp.]
MALEKKTDSSRQNNGLSSRNALILKIALFLNYLSKEDHQKLLYDLKQHQDNPAVDILKLMQVKNYIGQANAVDLKKTCVSFARAQEDSRFGSLCINFEFLTQSNLDLALEEQKRLAEQGRNIRLGDLLIDAGMLSKRQCDLILQKQKLENTFRKNTPLNEPPTADEISTNVCEDEFLDAPSAFDKNRMREIRENGIILLIQNDALKAFITKTKEFDDSICLEDLKFFLEQNGVIYGLVDDESLKAFVEDEKYKTTFLKAAEGLEPIDGTDAGVVYLFERDYLKPGRFSEDGTIDFKERGEIPFVSAGDVLAEKIPPKEGKDGVSVYGEAIPKADAMDISFVLGKGVRVSKDGLKVMADVNGNPRVSPSGEFSVNDAYYIEGDVDFNTGHVIFDKNVYITGSIKNGFRVEAINVVAKAVDGGIIKAQGDVFIQNGITESVIEAKGNIKAGFMHRSKAACMGDMTVVKEIVDTEVLLEGTFKMSRGRVYSSSIMAKGGAKIYSIGSEKSGPSTITVGISGYLEKKLQDLDSRIEKRRIFLETRSLEKNKIQADLDIIMKKLEDFDQSKLRTVSIMNEVKKNGPEKMEDKIELLQKSLGTADVKIHGLKNDKALLEYHLKKANHDILACEKAIKIADQDKLTLKRLEQASPSKPILDVAGKILAGTRINGRYAHLTLSRTLTRTRIMEINTQWDKGCKKRSEMVMTNL